MPASKINYITVYDGESQVYGGATKETVLTSPLPPGHTLDERHVFFITMHPDSGDILIHPLNQEEIMNAELKTKKIKESA